MTRLNHNLARELCGRFSVTDTSEGMVVRTGLHYDDGDAITVFVRRTGDNLFTADDNGEAAFRLMTDGLDLENKSLVGWLQSIQATHRVHWDEQEQQLTTDPVPAAEVADAVMRIAECSSQMQGLIALRRPRSVSDFKEQIIKVLREAAEETQTPVRFDVPVRPDENLLADALFVTDHQLAVVVANSAERLMEAELIWALSQNERDPIQVLAVVESIQKIGAKQFSRAQYLTDKAVEYEGHRTQFSKYIRSQISGH